MRMGETGIFMCACAHMQMWLHLRKQGREYARSANGDASVGAWLAARLTPARGSQLS